jgi:hypothetical protein
MAVHPYMWWNVRIISECAVIWAQSATVAERTTFTMSRLYALGSIC